jgi:FAD-dependent oxidoreductase family protein
MNSAILHSRLPVLAEVDLLVVGGGSAGCCAAIAAAEAGCKDVRVMMLERYGFLGGTSTGVLDTFYGFFTPGDRPRKVVGGVPDRVVDALAAMDSMYLRPNTYGAGTGVTYNPERLRCVWDALLGAAGVEVLCHAFLVDAETDSAGRIHAAVVASKLGLHRIRARRFIDASGDADLSHWAGVPYETAGELDPAQTLTTTFRLAGVDQQAFVAAGGKKMLAEKMAATRHPLPRRKGSFHAMAIPNSASTVAVRVADLNPIDPRELTRAEAEGRRQALVLERFVREEVPGFATSALSGLGVQIGVRETRRVYGEYRLTRDDCLNVARFNDAVLLCGAPIEDHRAGKDGEDETAWAYVPDGGAYDVPYRTLVARGRDDLWIAGRCFSATHDAHASCRSMAQTMAMGQAVGTAAAIALRTDCGARDVPAHRLREQLSRDGAVLTLPLQVAQTAADAWRKNRGA